MSRRTPARDAPRAPWWRDEAVRGLLYQALIVGAIGGAVWYLVSNAAANLAARHIATGFGFLGREAGFGIGETLVRYAPTDSYARAVTVGILNTLLVSAVGIVLCTVVGVIVGVARLSANWLVRQLAATYVETLRNTPVLLQLFLWYEVISESLPGPRAALQPLPGVFLSNRGLRFPAPLASPALTGLGIGVALAVALGFGWRRIAGARRAATGGARRGATGGARPGSLAAVVLPAALVILLPAAIVAALGMPLAWDMPRLGGFNFTGGVSLSPELTALTLGLTLYTASYVAEITRAGILAVSRGQSEAARALGLTPGQILRLVILPQAVRIIIPPLISQYLNLLKNSSLALLIGFPDLVSVTNTIGNQTGQSIETTVIQMAAFLAASLSISLLLNRYNGRIAARSR